MKKEPEIFIRHILESIETIEMFCSGVKKPGFLRNKEKQNAVIRKLEIIGEAVKNLPIEFAEKYPHTQWSRNHWTISSLVASEVAWT